MAKKKMADSLAEKKDNSKAISQVGFDRVGQLANTLNKHYGKNLIKTGDNIPYIHKVPFEEPMLDYVSDGGIPIARFTEFLGQEHSGKTRNALKAMGRFQKYCFGCHSAGTLTAVWELINGAPVLKSCKCSNCKHPKTNIQVFVDIEGTTDPVFMQYFGIDILGIYYVRTDLPSQAIGIVDTFLREPMIGLIVVDSVGSMGSDKEVETAIEDDKMNQNALFLNKGVRKWQAALNSNTNETGMENGTTMIVINQSYMTLSMYSTEVAQGGRGLRHGKGMSLKTKIIELNKDDKYNVFGAHIRIENIKNKTGIPYRREDYYLNLNPEDAEMAYVATNVTLQYIEIALKLKLIQQSGGWYKYNGQSYQGKDKLIASFDDAMKKEVDKVLYKL